MDSNNNRFESEYSLGDIVYLKTETDQLKYMITCIQFTIDGGTMYGVSQGSLPGVFIYEQELTTEKDYTYV